MILVNGDSITYGQGILDRSSAWPALVFGQVKNIAEPGSSNSSITRRTIEQILINQPSLLIIGWSGLYRLEFGDNYSKPKTILPLHPTTSLSFEILENWLGEYWLLKQFLLDLHHLKLFTDSRSIKFRCVNFGSDISRTFIKINSYRTFKTLFNLNFYSDSEIRKEFVLTRKLLKITASCWLVTPEKDMKENYLKANQTVSADDQHPSAAGHQIIATEIDKLLKNINIVTLEQYFAEKNP